MAARSRSQHKLPRAAQGRIDRREMSLSDLRVAAFPPALRPAAQPRSSDQQAPYSTLHQWLSIHQTRRCATNQRDELAPFHVHPQRSTRLHRSRSNEHFDRGWNHQFTPPRPKSANDGGYHLIGASLRRVSIAASSSYLNGFFSTGRPEQPSLKLRLVLPVE